MDDEAFFLKNKSANKIFFIKENKKTILKQWKISFYLTKICTIVFLFLSDLLLVSVMLMQVHQLTKLVAKMK